MGHPATDRGDALLAQRFADEFLQFVKRQRARGLPSTFAAAEQQRLFLIELVLDLAHQLFQNVFECHHSRGAAEFVHDDRQVQFAFKEQLEQALKPRGFGHIDELARRRQQLRPAAGFESHGKQVLDVDDPQRFVQVPAFAQGEARIACFFGHLQALRNTGLGIQRDNFLARPHDFAGDSPAQIQRVEDNVPAQRAAASMLLRRRHQQA